MKVLSLFDGISCGQVALERAGIKVDTYYASEIDENVSRHSSRNGYSMGGTSINMCQLRGWEPKCMRTRLFWIK